MLRVHGPGFSDDNGSDIVSSDPRLEPDVPGPGAVAFVTIGWCFCTGSTANMGTMAPRSAAAAALEGAVWPVKRRIISKNHSGFSYTYAMDGLAFGDTWGAGGGEGVRSMVATYELALHGKGCIN
jgi:hypothetical protein